MHKLPHIFLVLVLEIVIRDLNNRTKVRKQAVNAHWSGFDPNYGSGDNEKITAVGRYVRLFTSHVFILKNTRNVDW